MQLLESQIPPQCPKCGGPWMPKERDHWGEFIQCLPCSLTVDIIVGLPLTEEELVSPGRGPSRRASGQL